MILKVDVDSYIKKFFIEYLFNFFRMHVFSIYTIDKYFPILFIVRIFVWLTDKNYAWLVGEKKLLPGVWVLGEL